jgi:type II secretory pathway component PulJ
LTRATSAATLARVSLAELLVTIALLATVLAGTLTALDQGLRAYTIGAARVEAQQSGRIALERLAREIRNAGAGGVGFDAISVAERDRIVLHVDRDGDGTASAPGETIAWRVTGTVLRRDAGGGAQPIVDGVRSLVLEYLDAMGRPTAVPAEVRTVVLTLTTEGASGAGAVTLTTQSRLRTR